MLVGSVKLLVNKDVPVSVSPASRLKVIGALNRSGFSEVNLKPNDVSVSVADVKLWPTGPKKMIVSARLVGTSEPMVTDCALAAAIGKPKPSEVASRARMMTFMMHNPLPKVVNGLLGNSCGDSVTNQLEMITFPSGT